MASAVLPLPGTAYGPCESNCSHRDCSHTRAMAAQQCRFCGESIGYDRHFYDDCDNPGSLVHANCYEEACQHGLVGQDAA